jgi:hypothetical protein
MVFLVVEALNKGACGGVSGGSCTDCSGGGSAVANGDVGDGADVNSVSSG